MKARYDNHVIDRKFKPGDKVLALLPIPGRPLQARYFRLNTIDKKTSDLNYIINTPGRRKNKQMCHVNMLKEYFDRDSSISNLNNKLSHLKPSQQEELKQLIHEYEHLFPDSPQELIKSIMMSLWKILNQQSNIHIE